MVRKAPPPVSYDDDLALPDTGPTAKAAPSTPPPTAAPEPATAPPPSPEPVRSARRPILEKSDPTIVYLDPRGKHQLRQYAVAQGLRVRVHDLLLEAIEEWGRKR